MKLGIFGGTFDPIHNAHLFIAESARVLEKLDKVLFLPTSQTHYRASASASAEDRCAMVAQAIASNVHFGLDRTDLREKATGYTADLLVILRQRYPQDDFSLIIGADSLANNAWVRLEEILEALQAFVIAPRAGVHEEAFSNAIAAIPSALRSRVKTLNLPELPESATLIRKLLAEGKNIRYLLPEPVWRYIIDHNLYGLRDEVA